MDVNYPEPKGKLSEDDLLDLTQMVVLKITSIDKEITGDEWSKGMGWYMQANQFASQLSGLFGIDVRQVAAVVAVLSPRNRWSQNQTDTIDMLEHGECGALALGVGRAEWLIGGTDPDKILGGRKVRSFFGNIADPTSNMDVTLDGWMITILGLPHVKYIERRGVYDAIADAFRQRAAYLGIMPMQLQAALWIHGRGSSE